MTETFREMLYPLGYVAAVLFAVRFIVQWIASEMQKRSVVPASFWWLSIVGNVALFIHAFIQLQFHVFVVQGCNAVISWRNLNLMKPSQERVAFNTVLVLLFSVIVACTTLFFFLGNGQWFRIPSANTIPFSWHLMGFTGIVLFASRFWVQWWSAEKSGQSYLGKPFWWLSLSGTFLMLFYFYAINDPVNLIGPLLGLVPYVRNLVLINRETA